MFQFILVLMFQFILEVSFYGFRPPTSEIPPHSKHGWQPVTRRRSLSPLPARGGKPCEAWGSRQREPRLIRLFSLERVLDAVVESLMQVHRVAQGEPDIKPDRLLDDFGREAVAAVADLGHHRWLRLKVIDSKTAGDVTMPSPDLNPIEQVFAKLKKLLRKAEERTPEGVWRRIGTLLGLCWSVLLNGSAAL
jgi:hypothetical protein